MRPISFRVFSILIPKFSLLSSERGAGYAHIIAVLEFSTFVTRFLFKLLVQHIQLISIPSLSFLLAVLQQTVFNLKAGDEVWQYKVIKYYVKWRDL